MEFLTYDDVAKALGVNVKTVKRFVREGRLRPARIGVHTVRFLPDDVLAFVRSTQDPELTDAGQP